MNIAQRGLVMGLVTAASCFAASIPITNPSFESPIQASGGFTFDTATGWTVTGYAGVWFPTTGPNNGANFFSGVPDGNQILFEGYTTPGDATQSLGVSLAASTTYTLTYFVGQRYDAPLSTYAVSLLAGTTVLASDSGGAPSAGQFVQRTITFTTGVSPISGILGIDIAATGFSVTGAPGEANFDAFALSSAGSPEPASMLLFGGGLLGLSLIGRKFARK